MQVIEDTQGVADWFGMSPAGIEFEVAGPVEFEAAEPHASPIEGSPEGLLSSNATATQDGGSVARVRYQVSAPGFLGGGTWRFRAADDERIAWLEHHPDDIPDAADERTNPLTQGAESRNGSHRDHHQDDPHHVEHHH